MELKIANKDSEIDKLQQYNQKKIEPHKVILSSYEHKISIQNSDITKLNDDLQKIKTKVYFMSTLPEQNYTLMN